MLVYLYRDRDTHEGSLPETIENHIHRIVHFECATPFLQGAPYWSLGERLKLGLGPFPIPFRPKIVRLRELDPVLLQHVVDGFVEVLAWEGSGWVAELSSLHGLRCLRQQAGQ